MIYQNSLSYENNRRKRFLVSVIIHFLFTNNLLQMNTMEFKHTPGKWYQSHRQIPHDEDGWYATQIHTEDGETIATISWYPKPQKKEIIDGETRLVTETYREANATLIASAPNMLDALIRINEIIAESTKDENSKINIGLIAKISIEAINKATK